MWLLLLLCLPAGGVGVGEGTTQEEEVASHVAPSIKCQVYTRCATDPLPATVGSTGGELARMHTRAS